MQKALSTFNEYHAFVNWLVLCPSRNQYIDNSAKFGQIGNIEISMEFLYMPIMAMMSVQAYTNTSFILGPLSHTNWVISER